MSDNAVTDQPLTGYRILDLSRILAGPYCTMMLGDQGAEVIKVERPGVGDDTRTWGPPFAGGESAYYLCCNRNKKSVVVDLQLNELEDFIREMKPEGLLLCLAVEEDAQPDVVKRVAKW